MVEKFKFLDTLDLLQFGDALVGNIPTGIFDSHELLRAVADSLSFPAYFSENWNALFDCLRDLHWTEKRNVVLVHHGLPHIPRAELKIYLEVLRDAANDWKEDEPHVLVVVFDVSCKDAVADALQT